MDAVVEMGQTSLWKRLLAGDLTVQEQAMQERLRASPQSRAGSVESRRVLQDAAVHSPEVFFAAALSLLGADQDPAARRRLYTTVLEYPQFLRQLIRPDRFSRTELLEVCRFLTSCDPQLDVRLARLISGRDWDSEILDSDTVVHVLDLLNEISPGPRLIPILNHLTENSDPRTAAKATLLMARRIQNHDWIERHLGSGDPRLRATVLEALWGIDTSSARTTLRAGLNAEDNRAVGNAVVGLHLLGEPNVGALAEQMLEDTRPMFRSTGAWVMGKIGASHFVNPLQRALADSAPGVRLAARRALKEIRKLTMPVSAPLTAVVLEPSTAAKQIENAASLEGTDTPKEGSALTTVEIDLDNAHVRTD
jgi:hypothetical protein